MKKLFVFLLVGFLGACTSPAHTLKYNSTKYAPKPPGYQIQVLHTGNIDRQYKVIGQVRDTNESLFESARDILNNLKQAARRMGGDALLDLQIETLIVYDDEGDPSDVALYSAKVIRFI